MTEKIFTMEEIYEITNKFYIGYTKLFANQQISFHEYTIIENTIMRLQQAFKDEIEKELYKND